MFYVQFLCLSTLKFANKRHLHVVLLLLQIILELGTRQHCRDKVTLFSLLISVLPLSIFVVATLLGQRRLNIFQIFSLMKLYMKRCRVVVVEKLKIVACPALDYFNKKLFFIAKFEICLLGNA